MFLKVPGTVTVIASGQAAPRDVTATPDTSRSEPAG